MGCYLIAAQVVYVVFLKKIFVVYHLHGHGSSIQFGVGELLPAVAEYHNPALTAEHQVQFDVAMTKNIKVMVIALLFLFFGKEH